MDGFPSDRSTLRDTAAGIAPASPPGLATAKMTTDWPLTGSGTPTAAASATCVPSRAAASTSAGPTRLPATLMVSSDRPRMNQNPSSSTRAQSPWTQMPGQRDQ